MNRLLVFDTIINSNSPNLIQELEEFLSNCLYYYDTFCTYIQSKETSKINTLLLYLSILQQLIETKKYTDGVCSSMEKQFIIQLINCIKETFLFISDK